MGKTRTRLRRRFLSTYRVGTPIVFATTDHRVNWRVLYERRGWTAGRNNKIPTVNNDIGYLNTDADRARGAIGNGQTRREYNNWATVADCRVIYSITTDVPKNRFEKYIPKKKQKRFRPFRLTTAYSNAAGGRRKTYLSWNSPAVRMAPVRLTNFSP